MELSSNPPGIDMNDESNLELYSQLLLFKSNEFRDEILWQSPKTALQRTLQSLAHKLDLEYEYSLRTRVVRISRPTVPDTQMDLGTANFQFFDLRYAQDDGSFPSGGLTGSSSHLYDALNEELPVPFYQPDTHFSALATASESSMMVLDLENWSTFESGGLSKIDTPISPAKNQTPSLEFSTNDRERDHHFPGQWNQSQGPASPAMESTESSSQAQMSPDYLTTFASIGSELQNGSQQISDLPSKGLDSMLSKAIMDKVGAYSGIIDMDTDDSEVNAKPSRQQIFYCTDYPPCNLSFTKREHLARHIRKHTGERPFQCHCGRRFNRLDNLRRHTEMIHVNEAIPSDSLAATGTRFHRQVRSDIVQPLPRKNHNKMDTSVPTSTAYRRNSSSPVSDTWGSSPQQPASRSGSVSSFQSDRGRNGFKGLFRRMSSAHSLAGSGYEEIVFDSKSTNSGSQASGASGRCGPLDGFAKAAMNAVKRVGACWRCKFLRKTCSAESPCDLCPKRLRSNWGLVGCKRGDLKTQMLSIKLCPHPGVVIQPPWAESNQEPCGASNRCFHQAVERRERELAVLGAASTTLCREPGEKEFACPFLDEQLLHLGLSVSLYSSMRACGSSSPALAPLNECILAIAWEFNDRSSACDIIEILDGTSLYSLITLLWSAALYQSRLESDQLIAQSLICLRSCLEVLHVKDTPYLRLSSHRSCSSESCKVDCIASLGLHLTLYLDELSRVFFKKENLKSRNSYWLSTFYSFCIQAIVRKALQKISMDSNLLTSRYNFVESAISAATQYLHVAVNLFIASCGSYDPLTTGYSGIDEDLLSLQQTLGGSVAGSAEYLRKVFEIEAVIATSHQYSRIPETLGTSKHRGWYQGPVLQSTMPTLISDSPLLFPTDNALRDQAIKGMDHMQRLEVLVAIATSENSKY